MGKALVIRGGNFVTNKLATVSFIEPVPCTGISLSASTATMTKIGSNATLTAVATPEDTTDSIIWTSSDPQIVYVAGGVLIQRGVGEVTITASCGGYSASCVVVCTMIYNGNNDLFKLVNAAGYKPGTNDDRLKVVSSNGYIQYINKGEYGYPVFMDQSHIAAEYQGKGGIPLPYGATNITVTNPDSTVFDRVYFHFLDSKTLAESGNTHDSAKLILVKWFAFTGETSYEMDLTDYDLGNSDEVTITFYDTAQAAISDSSLNSIITFS